jgi:Spy/CpxP family protein refolding chaperone
MKQQDLHKLAAMKTNTMGAVTVALLLIGSLLVVQADDKKEAKDPLEEKYAEKEKEIGAALKSELISKEIAEKILEDYKTRLKAEQRKKQFQNGTSTNSDGKGGRYLLKIRDGGKHFKAEADGAVLFDSPVDTAEQRKKLNADLLKKLEQLEAQLVNRVAAFRARWEEIRKNEGQAAFNVRLNALPRWQRQKIQRLAFDPLARLRPGSFNGHNPFKDLDLTDDQQKEITAIRLKQMEEQLEYSEMMKELDAAYQKRMESVLTEEQKEKYKGLQSLQNWR